MSPKMTFATALTGLSSKFKLTPSPEAVPAPGSGSGEAAAGPLACPAELPKYSWGLFPADPVSAVGEDCGNRGRKSAARIWSNASGGSLAPTGGGVVQAASIALANRNSAAPLAPRRNPQTRTRTTNENRDIELGPTAHNKQRKNLAPGFTFKTGCPLRKAFS